MWLAWPCTDRWEVFVVVIQLGAILAVVVIYFQTFWQALIHLATSFCLMRGALPLSIIIAFPAYGRRGRA